MLLTRTPNYLYTVKATGLRTVMTTCRKEARTVKYNATTRGFQDVEMYRHEIQLGVRTS